MNAEPKPGHTLDKEFDLMTASADLLAVNTLISRLTRADDGTPMSTEALREARALQAALAARMNRHLPQPPQS